MLLTCSEWLGVSAERRGVLEDVIIAGLLLSSEADPERGDKRPGYGRSFNKDGKGLSKCGSKSLPKL